MKRVLYATSLLLSMLMCGCDDTVIIDGGNSFTKTNTTNCSRTAVICYLTKVDKNAYGGWDGDCPGTDVDAKRFAKLCEQNGVPYVMLSNSLCTARNVYNTITNSYAKLDTTKDNLFIFFYSGHGGQVYSVNGNEDDGLDETLCFYDGQFIDDYVWNIMRQTKSTTRIWYVTDCCNSETNYRVPNPTSRDFIKTSRGSTPNMIHYGGCNDGDSSYGSNLGGVFTTYFVKYYTKDMTYKSMYETIKTKMKYETQKPTYSTTGKSFEDKKLFE